MHHEVITAKLDAGGLTERCFEHAEVSLHQGDQRVIVAIAEPQEAQFSRHAVQRTRSHEAMVFGNNDCILSISPAGDFGIGGLVSRWQIQGVPSFVPLLAQNPSQTTRELGIDQKLHEASAMVERVLARAEA